MRRGLVGVAAVVLLAAAGAVVAAAGGGPSGELRWAGAPKLVTPAELPADRVLYGRVTNASLRTLSLDAERVRLLDAGGEPVPSTARFTTGFAHGLYSPRNAPRERAEAERRRLGEIAEVRPGQTVPVTLSWRVTGGREPARADLGGVLLALE